MGKIKVRPLEDNVLISLEKPSKRTETGIYLPETSSGEKPQEGIVMAVGSSKDIKVKKNQRVIFRQYSGTDIEVEGKKYLIVKNEDILAVTE